MSQEASNNSQTANQDTTQNNDNSERKDNSNSEISKDDIKDSSNNDEKKYESKEQKAAENTNLIPQNLEPKELGKKNTIVIGSFEPSTFHYSFKNRKDPLQIGMFPVFGYLQIPHIGVYGDNYEPTQLKALLELSMNDTLVSNLPKSIIGAVDDIMNKASNKQTQISDIFEGYVIIHDCPPYKQTQHFSMNANNLFNVMYHSWVYNTIGNLSNDQQIEDSLMCGAFEGLNVYQIRNEVKSIVDRGICFDKIEERSCFLHGFAFSPCNCDMARDPQSGYCSFYMIACTKDYKRACLSYHVFANNQDMDEILKWSFKEIRTVKELLQTFNGLQWGDIEKHLQILCRHY